jgi:hypothetical protein
MPGLADAQATMTGNTNDNSAIHFQRMELPRQCMLPPAIDKTKLMQHRATFPMRSQSVNSEVPMRDNEFELHRQF